MSQIVSGENFVLLMTEDGVETEYISIKTGDVTLAQGITKGVIAEVKTTQTDAEGAAYEFVQTYEVVLEEEYQKHIELVMESHHKAANEIWNKEEVPMIERLHAQRLIIKD